MSSSSEDEGEPFVLYTLRPEWKDVKPVEQAETTEPVVSIMYSEEYRTTMDYFRAVALKSELSPRALALTTDCIHLNPANYTVWHYRRKCLRENEFSHADELSFIEALSTKHPKNYQIWFHRRAVVEIIGSAEEEDRFVRKALMIDSKNYHAWGHRQWYAEYAGVLATELEFVDEMLQADIRNNSAWNYRFFVITRLTGFAEEGIRDREVAYALAKIRRAPNNESPWNYLRGVMKGADYSAHPTIATACDEMRRQGIPSPFIEEQTCAIIEQELAAGTHARFGECCELIHKLATDYDSIRANYWNYRLAALKQKYETAV